jgi:hypothetical protein
MDAKREGCRALEHLRRLTHAEVQRESLGSLNQT